MKHLLIASFVMASSLMGATTTFLNSTGANMPPGDRGTFQTNIGGTVTGKSLFTAPDGVGVRFLQINDNDSTTFLDAAGFKSALTFTKSDVGLGNVDNTSDSNKPVSTLTQTALNGKQSTLISGTNIMSVNGNSLLGSGNLTISSGLAADGTVATLRTANLAGSDNLATVNSKLARLVVNNFRKNAGDAGNVNSNRGVILALGDSVATNIGTNVQRQLGYGGKNIHLTADTANVTGTFTSLTDEWARTPHGYIRRMVTASSHSTIINAPGAMTAVAVSYLAKSGNGSFKLQAETNKTGGYADVTNAWVIETLSRQSYRTLNSPSVHVLQSAGLEAGMNVTGTGIAGGTTVSSVQSAVLTKTASTNIVDIGGSVAGMTVADVTGITPNMVLSGSGTDGIYIVSLNATTRVLTLSGGIGTATNGQSITFTGRTVTLSANATASGNSYLSFARTNAGSQAAGVLNTDNGSATERYCTAIINLGTEGADYYNIKLVPTAGTVDIVDVMFEAGGFGVANTNFVRSGWFASDWSEGGKQVSAHFSLTTQDVWDRALAWINPDVITFKGLNDWNTTQLVTNGYWATYINKVKAAAPNALLVVAGSHNTRAFPDRDTSYVDIDDYMRNWAATGDSLFVDVRSNMPAYSADAGSADNLWSDGLHIYDSGDQLRGGGQSYVAGMVYAAVKPAFDQMGPGSNKSLTTNSERPLPGYVNKIKLYDGTSSTGYNTPDQTLYIEGAPRKTVTIAAGQTGGQGAVNRSGFQSLASINNKVTALNLISNSQDSLTFGTSGSGGYWGFAMGIDQSGAANYGRSQNGGRIKVPFKSYSRSGIVIEGRSDSDASDRIFGIDIGATDAAEGTKLWSWNAGDGSTLPQMIYHGRTNDSNVTNFTYSEPLAATTINVPVNATVGSGANARVIGVIPSYASVAAGEAALGLGEVFYAEDVKKVMTTLIP